MLKIFILFLVPVFLFQTSSIPKRIEKKIDTELQQTFKLKSFHKENIIINDSINTSLPLKIGVEGLFSVLNNTNDTVGYFYYGKAKSKSAYFDYVVIFDKQLIIAKIKILAYRESYGSEIGSNRWLKQFIGFSTNKDIIYRKDIAAISGATISATSLTRHVNRLLKSIAKLHQLNVL